MSLRVIGLFILLLAILACSSSDTSNTAIVNETPPTVAKPILPTTPVPFSEVRAQLGEPLSSGLSVADIVEKALVSVVAIYAGDSYGTGFIVTSNGLILTNEHVVAGLNLVDARLMSRKTYLARVMAFHTSMDLAYLQAPASPGELTPVVIGDSDAVRVGDEVIVIGFPLVSELGQEPTVSRGIISAKRHDMLQTDAPVNPGNSGGPMLDRYGNVIGMMTSRVEESDEGRQVTGISFAIPINRIAESIDGSIGRAPGAPVPTLGPTPTLIWSGASSSTLTPTPLPTPFPHHRAATGPRGHQIGPRRPGHGTAGHRGPTPVRGPGYTYCVGSRPGSRKVRRVTRGHKGC